MRHPYSWSRAKSVTSGEFLPRLVKLTGVRARATCVAEEQHPAEMTDR
jgi:hypothetical protein